MHVASLTRKFQWFEKSLQHHRSAKIFFLITVNLRQFLLHHCPLPRDDKNFFASIIIWWAYWRKKYSWDANKFHFHLLSHSVTVYWKKKICVAYLPFHISERLFFFPSIYAVFYLHFLLFIVYSTKCWFMCEILFVNRWWNAASNKHLSYICVWRLRNIFSLFFFFF